MMKSDYNKISSHHGSSYLTLDEFTVIYMGKELKMKICILSGNPKTEGLCHSVIDSAKRGAIKGGAEVDEIRLCEYKSSRCQVCGNGWGTCRSNNDCT
jgi:hypothetical protein